MVAPALWRGIQLDIRDCLDLSRVCIGTVWEDRDTTLTSPSSADTCSCEEDLAW